MNSKEPMNAFDRKRIEAEAAFDVAAAEIYATAIRHSDLMACCVPEYGKEVFEMAVSMANARKLRRVQDGLDR